MKRKISIVLMALTLASAIGCGNTNLSAYERLSKASEALTEAEAYSMDMDMMMNMTMGEESLEMGMNGTSKIKMLDDTNFEAEQEYTAEVLGTTIEFTQWFKDGVMYQNGAGQKYAIKTATEDAMEQIAQQDLIGFEEDVIKSQSVEDNELTFVLDGTAMTDYVESQLGSILSDQLEGVEISISDVNLVVLLDDNDKLQSFDMDMDMTMQMDGESISMGMTMKLSNFQTEGIEISFPDDLDEYEIMDLETETEAETEAA